MRRYLSFCIRWGLLGAAMLFLSKNLMVHWREVRELEVQGNAWGYVAMALGIAFMAQLWSAIIWGWILAALNHPVPPRWTVVTFLKNTPAKYIPGSIWHMYGRVRAAQKKGLAVEFATLSVILEPMFVMAGALSLALFNASYPALKTVGLVGLLLALHPRMLNWLWRSLRQFQGKKTGMVCLRTYPLRVLIGATAFMGLRGLAFLCVVLAFAPLSWNHFQPLMSGFSVAWLLSIVVPAPGGLGVFEASALSVLDDYLSPALLLGAVATYRLVNICAEVVGAGLAYCINEGESA